MKRSIISILYPTSSQFYYSLLRWLNFVVILLMVASFAYGQHERVGNISNKDKNLSWPDPATNPTSALMLKGDWVPKDPRQIDFDHLPRIPSRHAIVSDVRAKDGVNQHNYLTYYNGRFWIMWSDGPGKEDRVGQRVAYATSYDGLKWSDPQYITPYPPHSDPSSPYYNTRSKHGFRWISRGFWQRNGELLALASLDEAAGFFGPSLELRAFRWNDESKKWEDVGIVYDNAINNFPPKRLSTGQWMMTRRTYDYKQTGIKFLIGGIKSINQWKSFDVPGSSKVLDAEEPYWWVLPDGNLMALFRDNSHSGFLYRSFSTDNGHSWSIPVQTNFPDNASKFNGLRLKDGRYVLVSNPNPKHRDPLALSISDDGMVFTKMGYLIGGRHVDYPDVIQHGNYLLIAFAGDKQTIEVIKVKISDLDKLKMSN